MKIFEIITEAKPKPRPGASKDKPKKSAASSDSKPKNKGTNEIRYNSEVGILYGLVGTGTFDLENPSDSISAKYLVNPEQIYSDIKKYLRPVYNSEKFMAWASIGKSIRPKIRDKQGTEPTKISWVAGANIAGGVTDIQFESGATAGISVKGDSGITLANLTPKALGIKVPRGIDGFSHYAKAQYDEMKQKIFTEVLGIAKSQPDEPFWSKDERFTVTYISKTDTFECVGKASGDMKTIDWPAEKILGSIETNAPWQRPFGDWFQANWQSKKDYARPLFTAIAETYETIIEAHLRENKSLAQMLRFGDKPYYYCTPKSFYYVPSIDQAQNLELKHMRYGEADGTSQLFLADIGQEDSKDYATIDIYMRYANGMFSSNPTVRVQSLRNPQYIRWELL
jgi:hypothetical protein